MTTVFIDGSAGTTGLRIHERLAGRTDLSTITLPDALRKDPIAKKEAMRSSDIVFLCLPDDAARESVSLLGDGGPAVIDTSTAHRTSEGWIYGFPELTGKREQILSSKRIANPGCHASGFVALIEPLVTSHLIRPDAHLTCFSITGYSGGGKKMIADYESDERDPLLKAPRQYGLTQNHKHLKEMTAISGLTVPPVFCPIVSDFYCGMEVTVSLFADQLRGSVEDIKALYRQNYSGKIVRYVENNDESGFLSAAKLDGKDGMDITVAGNEERILLIARFDNLGKGASGAAVQNMNLLLGVDETTGLCL